MTGNLEPAFVQALERIAVNGLLPDLTILIDLPADIGLARAHIRGAAGDANVRPDRFEREETSVHESRRLAFMDLARAEPDRFRIIDGRLPTDEIAERIHHLVGQLWTPREDAAEVVRAGASAAR